MATRVTPPFRPPPLGCVVKKKKTVCFFFASWLLADAPHPAPKSDARGLHCLRVSPVVRSSRKHPPLASLISARGQSPFEQAVLLWPPARRGFMNPGIPACSINPKLFERLRHRIFFFFCVVCSLIMFKGDETPERSIGHPRLGSGFCSVAAGVLHPIRPCNLG